MPLGERALTGVVIGAAPEPDAGALRDVLEVLDREPACPEDLLAAAARTAERFFTSTGEILRSALPARLPSVGAIRYRLTEEGALARADGPEGEILDRLGRVESVAVSELSGDGARDAVRALEQRGWVRPTARAGDVVRRREIAWSAIPLEPDSRARLVGRSRRGLAVLDLLDRLARPATTAEIRLRTGAGLPVLHRLAERGLVTSFEQERREEDVVPLPAAGGPDRTLTSDQAAATGEIVAAIAGRRYLPVLLEGVTGSGKTEVYLRAIRAALESGRTAVWLVPEIALTPVFARALRRQFGDRATVLHSALSERDRARAWSRIRRGEARIVIGPRSTVFAPVQDPGLFVVDEEQDGSYKQRDSPRYDAREVAAIRARAAGAALLFGSATPSLEAYQAAREGRLRLLRLPTRVESRPLPAVCVVDLRRERALPEEKGISLFSQPLTERLREVFARGEQAILLQPRRGYAPFLLCRECGFDFRCSRCSVSRTVHDRGRRLVCHYCGESLARPPACPSCGGSLLEAIGAGTERVADRFAAIFPGVPHAVLDRDSVRRRGAAAVLDDMESGRIACLIGTQMVAKGHDFARVSAVGVLSADTLLNFPDFRSAEKTFQLVAQVAGRAGRGDAPGTVHVQTFHPEHPAIRYASAHDLDGFARQELEFRRTFAYPPFSELAAVLVSSPQRERAEAAAASIAARLAAEGGAPRVSGPAPAPLERLKGRWRFQVLLRGPDRRGVVAALSAAIPERAPAGTQIAVDVDPQDLM